MIKSNSLSKIFPNIASQWHSTKNGDLSPDKVTYGSNKIVWWKCKEEKDHEWQTSIFLRTLGGRKKTGTGCPFCLGQKISKDNNLVAKFPHVAKQWHPTKNKNLKPENFTSRTTKIVWWKCMKGEDHEWKTSIYNRTSGGKNKTGTGCPFCLGHKTSKDNNLVAKFPHVAKQWHPTKNKNLKPEDFAPGTTKKVWWKCIKGEDHEWQASIGTRTKPNHSTNCPFCAGQKVSTDNNLLTKFPHVAKQWHPTKNKDLKPEDCTPYTSKSVWWICNKSSEHIWEAKISNRTSHNSGCPFCNSQTSSPEIRILTECQKLFGDKNVHWRHKIHTYEVDIFIKPLNIGIEYDGYYWHKDKIKTDKEKKNVLFKKGIDLINVREKPLKSISKNDISISSKFLNKDDMDLIIKKILLITNKRVKIKLNKYLSYKTFINDYQFKRYLSFLPSPPPEYSIANMFPEVIKFWHPDKNKPLLPENFTHGSAKTVWWKCPKGDDHEWQTPIRSRVKQRNNCPFCKGLKISKDNTRSKKSPTLAKQWHPTKNNGLTPNDFTFASTKSVWWKCTNDCIHEWKKPINYRYRLNTGCLLCSNKKKVLTK